LEEVSTVWEVLAVLDAFYKANSKREEDQQVSYKEFYNEELNRVINLTDQYVEWIE
jgi:hypothetical protein